MCTELRKHPFNVQKFQNLPFSVSSPLIAGHHRSGDFSGDCSSSPATTSFPATSPVILFSFFFRPMVSVLRFKLLSGIITGRGFPSSGRRVTGFIDGEDERRSSEKSPTKKKERGSPEKMNSRRRSRRSGGDRLVTGYQK